MAKSKKQIKSFILKTLLPYKENPNTCGFIGKVCVYLTDDGRKCAVGKWMKQGEWQKTAKSPKALENKYGLDNILLKPARDMEFSVLTWTLIQTYHDALSNDVINAKMVNDAVEELEESFEIELPELKLEKDLVVRE